MASPTPLAIRSSSATLTADTLTARIAALVQACLATVTDHTLVDAAGVVAAAEAAQAAAASSAGGSRGAALLQVLRHFGWNGASFTRPLDARHLASRLRAFLFEGLATCGGGTYSTVFTARCCLTGAAVALKRVKLDACEEGLPANALREVSLLRQLAGSPHIIQ